MRSFTLAFACLLVGCGSSATDADSPSAEGTGASGATVSGAGGDISTSGASGNATGTSGNASATGGNATGAGGRASTADASASDSSAAGGSMIIGLLDSGALGREGGASASACGTTDRKTDTEGRPRACVKSGVCDSLHKSAFVPMGTAPDMKLGVMTDLGPPFGPITDGGNALAMTIDPNNSAVLYVGVEARNGGSPNNGVWRSRDGGATWKVLGTGSDKNPYDCQTSYLDLPINIRVDPQDSNHLYATEGVRGAGNGFWVSWDGGENWTRAYSSDLTAMSVDPCDFCHVIVGSHEGEPIGVLETSDGGYSWVKHPPPAGQGWSGGSYGVNMLYDPASGQGDPKTWLVHNGAMWRTTDAGTTWTKVSDIGGIHGFTTVYYAKNGGLYSGAGNAPARSTDNGLTWKSVSGLANQVYYGLSGDGTNVYAMADGYPPPQPLMSSTEADPTKWTPFGDMRKVERGMQHPRFDPNSGILYFVNNMILHGIKVAEARP